MYALTINPTLYVSHIRQFWSTARIKTTDEGTKILATVDGKPQTISESSIKRNLKLRDEAGISYLLDAEHFKNLTLMGYNILPNQKFSFQKGRTIPLFPTMPVTMGEGSGTPTEPHHTPSPEAQQTLPTATSSPSLPPVSTSTIPTLKARVKLLKDRDGGGIAQSREDAPIKGRSLDEGEEAGIERSTEKGSDDTEEMVNVLTSLDAASVLSSGVQVTVSPAAEVTTVSVPPATISVPTSSDVVPTASPIFTTATMSTPYSRRKGKEKMVESETPKKKKLQEQMDVQMARQLEEEMAKDAQRMNEQITRDAEITRIHTEEELQIMIDGLERNNETVAKQLYKSSQIPISAKKATVKEATKIILYIKEGERLKRKGISLEQDSPKKVKTSEEVSEEDLKAMMQLVLVEEVYVEALQLWALVKETLNIRQAASDKEKELWVELKRLFKPDVEDQL
nr:hypothetical protein [Tanacetum cinerariifolium]